MPTFPGSGAKSGQSRHAAGFGHVAMSIITSPCFASAAARDPVHARGSWGCAHYIEAERAGRCRLTAVVCAEHEPGLMALFEEQRAC